MKFPIVLSCVGGWIYFLLDLALLAVEELNLIPKTKLGVDLPCSFV